MNPSHHPLRKNNHIYVYFLLTALFSQVLTFQYHGKRNSGAIIRKNHHNAPTMVRCQADNDNSDDEAPNLGDDDWRDFRARLVLQNNEGGTSSPSGSSSTWAYDSGHVIEPGSIILAKVEPDFCYFGLNQQYFHKSAMLVTYHVENEFTKGIILNRPTNLFLGDDDFIDESGAPFLKVEGGSENNDGKNANTWRIWFGGDVRGLYSEEPEIICLHSITTDLAKNVSEEIMKNVLLTNYEGARKIIDAKEASSSDFWLFAGYAGWTSGQLLEELKSESWYMVAADSETVWNELVRQRDDSDADPRDAGLKTWSMLMGMIGKGHEAQELSESFADLTLKEWAADAILFNLTMDEIMGTAVQDSADDIEVQTMLPGAGISDSVDKMVRLALDATQGRPVEGGTLLRGSVSDKSPFLLTDQMFHKSILLMLQDDEMLSVGVMLNHPTINVYPLTLPDGNMVEINIRFGGSFGIPGVIDQPLIFLHSKQELKERHFGESVGLTDGSKIWICSEDQAAQAILQKYAEPNDFMVIRGLSIWNKDAGKHRGGILGEILDGRFEVMDSDCTEKIWSTLLEQTNLSLETIDSNCRLASKAWDVAGKKDTTSSRCVYGSTVNVSELADDALRYWIEAFLLGEIVSAGKYSAFE